MTTLLARHLLAPATRLTHRLRDRWHRWQCDRRLSQTPGRRGEQQAARFLKRHGYRILQRNARVDKAELDLIALAPDGHTLVFVEVKTSMQGPFHPATRFHPRQQQRMMQAAVRWMKRNHLTDRPLRFDLVGVLLQAKDPEIQHLCGVLQSRF